MTFVDASRTVRLPGRAPGPRGALTTIVRYPAVGPPRRADVRDARPQRAAGPFPLIVFGHGFAVTPAPYAALLRAWARAGYVVAAPVFPLENAHAPGGPDESDLVNQPRDMSVVISRMLSASRARRVLLRPSRPPRDRGERPVRRRRDGARGRVRPDLHRPARARRGDPLRREDPGRRRLRFPAPSPPLLATQGTADTINPPRFTFAFFDLAPRPKYLLAMFGAPHLGPYTDEQPQLGVVERVTIAFFDRYLKRARQALVRITRAGDVPGVSHLSVFR